MSFESNLLIAFLSESLISLAVFVSVTLQVRSCCFLTWYIVLLRMERGYSGGLFVCFFGLPVVRFDLVIFVFCACVFALHALYF